MINFESIECGIFFLSIFLFLLVETIFKIFNHFRRPEDFPPGPSWLIPFIGNSRYLRKLSKKLGGQHKAFEFLSKKFNSPIFSLKLGREHIVVGMTYPIVKEIYSREEFEGRPDNFFLRLRTMGTRLGITCTDGKFWNEQRNFVVRQLRNIGYGKSIMHNRVHEEMCEIVEILKSTNEKPTSLSGNNILATSVVNILWTFVTGSKIKRDDDRLVKFFELLQKRSKAFDMSGGMLSQMPWMRFIAPEATGYNLIKDLNSKFYEYFMEIVDEHLRTYSKQKANDDLIYAYIKEMKERDGDSNSTFNVKQLIMVILDIFIGGAQTTSTTIDVALMTMLIHPDVQKKCREEIKKAMEADGVIPSYSDRHKTPYTDAVLMEVQRFYCIVPVGGPRRTLKDCKLESYKIPKNTTILIGLKSALNDENHWKEPKTFNPERFLDSKMKIINTDKLIPFGTGRRRCLGDQLAKECIYKFFVGILSEFTLEKSENEKDFPSLELVPGIILSPKPYKIVFKSDK